ncbi:FHA domain-containing protein [Synechococcus moorigangaii CMS01]|nr:FHA domain-containing protein [Synechococcus moorigangaii CMS01]
MPEFILKKDRLVVGRCEPGEKPVDINLNDFYGANTVSRQHPGIYQKGGQWNVQDLGSFNGTFIKPVEERHFYKLTVPTSLNSGDEISFGKICLRFDMD